MKQKLSIKARKAKAKRDKAFAMTPGRKAKKAENQRLRRKAKKKGFRTKTNPGPKAWTLTATSKTTVTKTT